jgi:hypothetical protein
MKTGSSAEAKIMILYLYQSLIPVQIQTSAIANVIAIICLNFILIVFPTTGIF